MVSFAGNFNQDIETTFGDKRVKIMNGGKLLSLSLDKNSGSGFRSKNEFMFGRFDMQLMLIANNSAGTVTTYYLSSEGSTHDEIDFEFLGNVTGEPYTVHTNVFSQGKGNREQQFHLWFDPTKNFHNYTILWNAQNIIVYKNTESSNGIPFLKDQPMRIYSSLWNADDWATRGGLEKTDWSKAPFRAFYRNFNTNACIWSSGSSSCSSKSTNALSEESDNAWQTQGLDAAGQKNHMVYNYCSDLTRFPQGVPIECKS